MNLVSVVCALSHGEESLCTVCHMYPRFAFLYNTTTEYSLSMACEEAARIIITRTGAGKTAALLLHPAVQMRMTVTMSLSVPMILKTCVILLSVYFRTAAQTYVSAYAHFLITAVMYSHSSIQKRNSRGPSMAASPHCLQDIPASQKPRVI
jgi:hypothetical protein